MLSEVASNESAIQNNTVKDHFAKENKKNGKQTRQVNNNKKMIITIKRKLKYWFTQTARETSLKNSNVK